MKKIIVAVLLIAVICTAAGVLVACSNATTQGQLENVWQPYERYTYSVSYKADDGSDASGTYVNEIRHYDAGATVGLGSVELASVAEGYLVTGTLTAGDRTLFNACYYALSSGGSYLVPSATYRKETAEGKTVFEYSGTYDGATLNYSGTREDGTKLSGSLGLSQPYYDNNQFHQALRGVGSLLAEGFSFPSFNVALVAAEEQTVIVLSASVTATASVPSEIPAGDSVQAFDCLKMTLSRSTTIAGESQSIWFASSPVKCVVDGDDTVLVSEGAGWELKNVIVKIEEPYKAKDGSVQKVTYTLSDIDLTLPASDAE